MDIPRFLNHSVLVVWHSFLGNFRAIAILDHRWQAAYGCAFLKKITDIEPTSDTNLDGSIHEESCKRQTPREASGQELFRG
ncbi:hypothetical protein SUGI_0590820 [Cryptomeria japonica]|nr:hypothetical protein SUGI_0590820 [Cryptomeria japonica]